MSLSSSSQSIGSCQLNLATIEAVLFDLDGTLVDVDMHTFIPRYLHYLTSRLSPFVNPQRSAKILRQIVSEMLISDDGRQTMEERLVSSLVERCNLKEEHYRTALKQFIQHDLPQLRPLVKAHPLARDLVKVCLARDWIPVLATNPIFPREVVHARLVWGGLDDLPFVLVTAYETARFCKPQPGYFTEVMSKLNVNPRAGLMIGNDTAHDLSASQVGLQTCLLTTWQIDRGEQRFSADWEGTHADLLTLLQL